MTFTLSSNWALLSSSSFCFLILSFSSLASFIADIKLSNTPKNSSGCITLPSFIPKHFWQDSNWKDKSENMMHIRSLLMQVETPSELCVFTSALQLLSCQPRVTVTSCFVSKVIRDLWSIDHLCINPIHRIWLIHKWYIDSRLLKCMKWSVQVNVLLSKCKQNITSLSLLAGTTVRAYWNRYCPTDWRSWGW